MRSPFHRSSRRRSPSPSPPRPTQKSLKSIRITIANQPGKILLGSKLTSRREEPDFKGPEDDLPRSKEQKKIQIEIRRSIASNRISRSPVRRSIRDPNTVYLARSHEEGQLPIFDRDEIKRFIPKHPEKRVVAIINDNRHQSNQRKHSRSRSRSPLNRMHSSRDDRKPVHDRLGNNSSNHHRDDRKSIRDRLGGIDKDADDDRVLDREEIESRRPQVRPWEVNPEFVPKNRYYFEHDNRESFQGFRGSSRGSFRGSSRGGSFRGSYRGNYRGGRGSARGFVKRSRVESEFEWKHDKFHEVQDNNDS